MKIMFYIVLLLISTNVFAYDDQDGGDEYYSCSAALEISMEDCTLLDHYDQDHSFDTQCISQTMQSYGFTKADYELEDNNAQPNPGYNDYICSLDVLDYD